MAARIDIKSLANATLRDGLPIPNFVRQLRAQAGGAEAAVHTGATSQDVLDTALSLTLQNVSDILTERLQKLDSSLTKLASENGDAPLMSRTRMQSALPIAIADRSESWRRPLKDHITGLDARMDDFASDDCIHGPGPQRRSGPREFDNEHWSLKLIAVLTKV